jgi:hypothetical protein
MIMPRSTPWILALLLSGAIVTATASEPALLLIEPTKEQPRNSEGDILELADGRLCLIYSRFTGGRRDHSAADLAMRVSEDGGETWSDDKIVVTREGGENVMSVSLLRLADGRIALFYLDKRSIEDCRVAMRISTDEAATFGPPKICIPEVGYYVLNNDRAVQLKSGRVVLPVAQHNWPELEKPDWQGRVMCYLSDDAGKTWRRSQSVQEGYSPAGMRITTQEPGVVELTDGRLMMYCRTDAGSQYVSHSGDGGETWSPLRPSKLMSPLGPATIERIPWSGELIGVWSDHSGAHAYRGGRSPHCIAISSDEGKTWTPSVPIEPDPNGRFDYTSMSFVDDRMLLSYCTVNLNHLKVISLPRARLAEVAAGRAAGAPRSALLDAPLDYGRSFINTKAPWNSPRFWVESRCRITDEKTGEMLEYYQAGLCKSEDTFARQNLFTQDNYDFLPVFSVKETIAFRRRVRVGDEESYREVRPVDDWWDGIEPRLRTSRIRVLKTPEEIFAAMQAGKPIVGQTEIRDEKTGRVAVIEYPVKTINFERNRKDWQVDTGPVIFPDLSAAPSAWSKTLRLAHIAFNTADWADFIVDQPTPLEKGDEARTYHYSGHEHRTTRNVLLAVDGG